MRDRYNISLKENWAESIVCKQWDLVYWNSLNGVDDVQLEAIPRIASAFCLLLKDLHISWYLYKSSKDIYHNAKQLQEEAQGFVLSENSKPIVTLAILKCVARDIIQAIDPHEDIVWSSGGHLSYCIQVVAMENYLDHKGHLPKTRIQALEQEPIDHPHHLTQTMHHVDSQKTCVDSSKC